MGIKKNTIILDHKTQLDDDVSNLEGHIKHFGKSVLRERNPHHQFKKYENMKNDDDVIFDEEIDDLRYVVRTYHDRTNHKYLEFRTLYWCNECNDWCNKGELYRLPIKLGKSFIKDLHDYFSS
jgi:hypothetical protein